MTSDNKCPIWGTSADTQTSGRDGVNVDSPRAGGRYFISRTAEVNMGRTDDATKARLTTWLVDQRRLGIECPEIMSTTIDEAERRRPLAVHERADNLLRYLRTKSDLLGAVVKFYALDNSKAAEAEHELLAWTGSRQISEVITLAEYCAQEAWVEHRATERTGASKNTIHELMLRPPGYARLAELDGASSASDQAFVAMWFDNSMNDAYEKGIAAAIADAGYQPVRIDGKEHNNKIDDEIIAEIRRSRFLIADFTQGETGARGGVYYEAGFAHGPNIPVIFTCREDALGKVHFDTRQYNHIVWKASEDLRERLAQRISATIGDGPKKNR
ncbi:hypothetical protein [Pelagibacterium halotolerans]|uniref:hypothetical protein n=1 Tax=Pelagibacterium halotolerans TaxID=531813 RepID=UPI0038517FDC